MNIAFIFLHPFSASLGSTVRVRELANSLAKFGVRSYILSPFERNCNIGKDVNIISISDGMQRLGLSNYLYRMARKAYYNKFLVRHYKINRKLQLELAKRFALNIANVLGKLEIDFIQAEQDVALLTAIEVKKKMDLPLLVDLHNITAEELVAAGIIERGQQEFNALHQLSREALSHTDLVAVVSDEMKDYVVANYDVPSKNVVVVPPGGRPRVNDINNKAFPFKVVYSGLVAYREHVDLFVKSIPIVNEKSGETKFYITRKGEVLNDMRRLAKDLGVSPIYFWYPYERQFYDFLASCYLGVLPSSNNLARRMGTPVKLFDYFSVGLPVVANGIDAWTNLIKDEKVGLITKDDPAEFASGILRLLHDKELAEECGRRALELVRKRYHWNNSAKILLDKYTHF